MLKLHCPSLPRYTSQINDGLMHVKQVLNIQHFIQAVFPFNIHGMFPHFRKVEIRFYSGFSISNLKLNHIEERSMFAFIFYFSPFGEATGYHGFSLHQDIPQPSALHLCRQGGSPCLDFNKNHDHTLGKLALCLGFSTPKGVCFLREGQRP